MTRKLLCRTLIEVLGKPKEHVEKAMQGYIERIKKDERYQVQRIEFAEIKKQESDLWATFAELEMEVKDLQHLTNFCFDYMPSVVEILEPAKIEMTEKECSDFFSDLQGKLHQVDMVAKQVKLENDNFSANMSKLLRNYLVVLLGERNLTMEQLHRFTGMKEQVLGDFLDKLIDEGVIKMEEDVYYLNQEKLKEKEVGDDGG